MITLTQDQEIVRTDTRVALRTHGSVLVYAPTGWGKCLGRGTPVMMFDGTIKAVEDVCVGDRLMGPDSTPRRVLSTCVGREMLYRVTPTKGDAYVVNASHILSLKMNAGSSKWDCSRSDTYKPGKIHNIEVRDYLKRSATFKHCAKGWRVGVEFAQHPEPVLLDPYFLGAWLGDGTSRKPSITTGDDEIAEFCKRYFSSLGLRTTVEWNSENSVNLHCVNARVAGNPLKDLMRSMHLLGNKHIPNRYLTGSRSERLEVLAGIIDTDGYLRKAGYSLTLKDERLFDDVLFLARSLGFAAYKSKVKKTCGNNGKVGEYFHCYISGDVDEIPVKLPRKKSTPRMQIKDVLVTGIKVEPIGEGDYYGFEIDGDRLFLLGDFTVTHNTVFSSALIDLITKAGKRVIFAVHRLALLKQTAVTLDGFGLQYSYIAAGYHHNVYRTINIASIDTLKNRLGKHPADYLFIDEAQLSASPGWAAIVAYYKSQGTKIIGLSGSPIRLDGKPLGSVWDTMVMGPSPRWLIENGRLSKYRAFSPAGIDVSRLHARKGEYVAGEVDDLIAGKAVMSGAVRHWRKHAEGKRTIAFAPSIARSMELAAEFQANGLTFVALDANTPQADRDRAFLALADRQIHGLVNVNLFAEGFDMSAQVGRDVPIECVLDMSPTQSLAKHLQRHGRGLRRKPEPAVLLDLVGGFARLGLPDEDREWSLEGEDNGKRSAASQEEHVRQCPQCFAAHNPAPKCPECGHVYVAAGRKIAEVEGELVEVDQEEVRQQRERQTQKDAWALADKIKSGKIDDPALQKEVKYLLNSVVAKRSKHPEKWAARVLTARMAKRQGVGA